jgi:micrococcal nuclease
MKRWFNRILCALFSLVLLAGCAEPAAEDTYSDRSASSDAASVQQNESGDQEAQSQPAESSTSEAKKPHDASSAATSRQAKVPGVPAKVVKVVDGDTLQAIYEKKVTTIRVLLIDTPETHHPRLGVQPFGPEASQHARDLLQGKTVHLEVAVNGGRDKYNRLLAYVYVDGKSFAEEQLSRGLARVAYVYPPNTKYVDQYRQVEAQARSKHLGIWSVPDYARSDGYHPEVVKGTEAYERAQNSGGSSTASSGGGKNQFAPDGSGNCGGAIKGNASSRGKIYHMPGSAYYDVTKAEACFKSRDAATKAGFRAAK